MFARLIKGKPTRHLPLRNQHNPHPLSEYVFSYPEYDQWLLLPPSFSGKDPVDCPGILFYQVS